MKWTYCHQLPRIQFEYKDKVYLHFYFLVQASHTLFFSLGQSSLKSTRVRLQFFWLQVGQQVVGASCKSQSFSISFLKDRSCFKMSHCLEDVHSQIWKTLNLSKSAATTRKNNSFSNFATLWVSLHEGPNHSWSQFMEKSSLVIGPLLEIGPKGFKWGVKANFVKSYHNGWGDKL